MKIKIVIWLLLGLATNAYSQKKHDYNWLFGYGSGVPDSTNPFGGVIMSFNNNKIEFIPQERDFWFNYQTNSYSDTFGRLRYMSNGCSMADENAQIILNGDSLGFGKIWGVNCPISQPIAQAGVFLNFTNQDSLLIFLHIILDTIGNSQKAFIKCIYETIIDIKKSEAILKNNIILYDTLYGSITAIPSKDNGKWWIMIPRDRTNEYYTLLYSSSGTEKILKQAIGYEHLHNGGGGTQAIFSPDGKKYAIYSPLNGLQVFDFDRLTGELRNFNFYNLIYSHNIISGCSFSTNSKFLYVSTLTEVLQVDLEEPDPSKAVDTVGVFDWFFDPYATTYKQMALGPDCRIYIASSGGNQYLHVILYPDRKGKECQLINRGLKLPTRNANAIPNFPHYRVDEPYPCDSTIRIKLNTDVDEAFKFREGEILMYPNPVKSGLVIHDIKQTILGKLNIRLLSLQGQQLYEINIENTGEEIHIPVRNLSTGMYFIQVINDKGRYWVEKFLKE